MCVSSKVNLYKSLDTKLADQRSSFEKRANELRDASHALVRDIGNIGGGLDSNNLFHADGVWHHSEGS